MAGRRRRETLRFRGAPGLVEALAPVSLEPRAAATLALDVDEPKAVGRIAPLALQAEPAGTAGTWLRFDLPPTTPPGTYEGTVQVSGERYPISVEVQPQAALDVSPASFSVSAAPGGEAELELTLVNEGNVPVEIGRAYAFNLLEPGGIEAAIHEALTGSGQPGERRLGRFAEQLAERHGGLVRVAVEQGAGTLEPGELRDVRARLRFGDDLKPGTVYASTWSLANLNISIQVTVEPRRRRKESAS